MKKIILILLAFCVSCGSTSTKFVKYSSGDIKDVKKIMYSRWVLYPAASGASEDILNTFVEVTRKKASKVDISLGTLDLPRALTGRLTLNPVEEIDEFMAKHETDYIVTLAFTTSEKIDNSIDNPSTGINTIKPNKDVLNLRLEFYNTKTKNLDLSFAVIQEGLTSEKWVSEKAVEYIKRR